MSALVQLIGFCPQNRSTIYTISRSFHRLSQLRSTLCLKNRKDLRKSLLKVNPNVNNIYERLSSGVNDSKRQLFSWKAFAISGGIVVLFLLAFREFKREKMSSLELERRRAIGKASIGGQFDLIDQNGQRFTSKDLLGKWVLLYFGFTHCPDICPDEIEKMVKAVDIITKMKDMDEIQMVFITVDPERDSTQAIKGYLKEFSDKIIGLTGTKEQIEAATHAYRVYYSSGPRDHENDYIVDHTIIMYLINPKGEFIDYYGQTKTAEDIATGVTLNVLKYRTANKKFGIF